MTHLLRHRLEAWIARAVMGGLGRLSPARASDFAGLVARTIGPLLPVSRIARRNLTLTLPHLGRRAHRAVVRGAWDNLGRNIGEFPHLASLLRDTPDGPGWRVEGEAILLEQAALPGGALFVSGHIGNWELMPMICARYGLAFAPFYRAADNPLVDRVIQDLRARAVGADVPAFPKGARGARDALAHLARGGHLGILADQKMNDGVQAALFSLPAMTAGATAAFALRHCAPIIFGVVRREGPARLVLRVDRRFEIATSDNRRSDILAATQVINDQLEGWIRETPESWLWMHRRFPKDLYRKRRG